MSTQTTAKRYLRFAVSDRTLHLLLLTSFTMLGITGLVQKYSEAGISVWLIQLMGGIEQTRLFHHTFAVMLIMVSIAHVVQIGYRVYVQRVELAMLPVKKDVTDFFDAMKYNLRMTNTRPHYPRFNFIEKMEYWAVVWGTVLMTLTGYVLWNPILVTTFLPGEVVPAAKIAHGMEAILAVLAIITWHFYFVHMAKFNKSIFTGYLSADEMEEEHGHELERRLEGDVHVSPTADLRYRRLRIYVPLATLFILISVVGTWRWLTAETTAISTVPRIAAEENAYQPVPLKELPVAVEPSPVATPLSVISPAKAAIPSIPHGINDERSECSLCHAVDSQIRPAPADHQGRSDNTCTTCHQPAGGAQ